MNADKIKYIADQIIGLIPPGFSFGDNYRQHTLTVAVLICIAAFGALILFGSAGIMILLNYLESL